MALVEEDEAKKDSTLWVSAKYLTLEFHAGERESQAKK